MAFLKFFHFWMCFGVVLALVTFNSTMRQLWFLGSTFIALLPLASWLMSFSRKYFLNPHLSSEGKAVLITGCDSGIGYLLAKRLDKLEYQVFAGCLNPLGKGALLLEKYCSERLHVLSLDVTNDESVQAALNYVKQNLKNNVLWAIVNNAGVAQAGEIEWTPMEDFQNVYEVNTFGVVRVTKAFLSLLRQSKGRVIHNTSFCAHLTFPGYVGYCMSKSAAAAFSTGLRIEMVKWGVKSISVEPFFYKTPLTTQDGNLKLIQETWDKNPEEVKRAYGVRYLSAFKASCKRLMKRGSNHISEVLDCFEDAIASVDPLTAYFPCYFPHKVGLSLFTALPRCFAETYTRLNMPFRIKPAGLDNQLSNTEKSTNDENMKVDLKVEPPTKNVINGAYELRKNGEKNSKEQVKKVD